MRDILLRRDVDYFLTSLLLNGNSGLLTLEALRRSKVDLKLS